MTPDIKERGGTVHVEYCPYCMSPVEGEKPCPSCGLTAGSYVSQSKHLPAGTILRERYLIGRVLGEGGFGITYIGRDLVLGLKVAIKEYFPTDKASRNAAVSVSVESFLGAQSEIFERGKQRFLQEARTMARLDRLPNIVSVRDFFEENSTAYIVMEYIDGTTLSELTKQRGGVMPAWELLHLIEPLFDSLSAMHELHLIHRDISPDNLMLEHGIIKLLDFGCAREAADGDATMTIMLRHGYAPLEQYQSSSGAQGAWTDVYALAATIYYCITGNKPPQAMDRIFEDTLVPPRKLGAELSVGQEQALMHALRVRPRERYQSVKEFHTALYEGVVTVRLEGGDEEQEISVAKGDVLKAAELPVPVKEGYIFTGWYTDENRQSRLTELTVKDGLTLYAGWRQRKKPENDRKRTKKPFWKNRVFQISAAAVAGVAILGGILGLALSGRPGTPGGASESQNSSGPEASSTPGTSGPSEPIKVEGVARDFGQLTNLLSNPGYSSIVIEGDVVIDGPTIFKKPVRVKGRLNVVGTLTVQSELTVTGSIQNNRLITVSGEDAYMNISGDFNGSGLLHTEKGGTVRCGRQSFSNFRMLWTEGYDDLVTEDGADIEDIGTHVSFDEEEAFDGAVHVTDARMLRSALSNPQVKSVAIDGTLRLDGGTVDISKPVTVMKGATLTADGDTTLNVTAGFVNSGTVDERVSFNVTDGAVLVNRGELRGDRVDVSSSSYLVNTLNLHMSTGTLDGGSVLVNIGNAELTENGYVTANAGGVINLGTMKQLPGCVIDVQPYANLENYGNIDLGGQIYNSGSIISEGIESVSIFNVTGILDNYRGALELSCGFTTGGEGAIRGGAVKISEHLMDAFNAARTEDCNLFVLRDWPEEGVDINTVDALLRYLESDTAGPAPRIVGDITVDGDLRVTKPLYLNRGNSLTVNGDLTVDGTDIVFDSDVSARAVSFINGASAFICNVTPISFDSLTVSGGSDVFVYTEMNISGQLNVDGAVFHTDQDLSYGGIRLTNGARFCALTELRNGIDVGDGCFAYSKGIDGPYQYKVGRDAAFVSSGFFGLGEDGSVVSDGDLQIVFPNCSIGPNAKIESNGTGHLDCGSGGECHFEGRLTNNGELMLSGHICLDDNGALYNNGTLEFNWGFFDNRAGRVVNRGRMYVGNKDDFRINNGDWSGPDVEI